MKKKLMKKNEPADKNTVCSDKSIQVCNFCRVFQTLLKSCFIDAVNTSEIHFQKKILQKPGAGYTQMRVIHPLYGNWEIWEMS